jgi:RNA polymerase sigma-70 factor (ECF subfamily)
VAHKNHRSKVGALRRRPSRPSPSRHRSTRPVPLAPATSARAPAERGYSRRRRGTGCNAPPAARVLYVVSQVREAVEVVRPEDDPGLEATFQVFFAARADELVRIAYLMTGDLAEAEDLAQEALVRVWRRWAAVSNYEHPEAFARRVLHNLVIGRWRRRRSAPPPAMLHNPVPAPGVEHLDVLAALGRLPARERSAIVLHDLVGLDAAEIGLQVGARPGTVRQWLHRGRGRLAAALDRSGPDAQGGGDARQR